jgi:hypothetical protein
MKFYNDFDIQRARQRFANSPVLNQATALLQNVAIDADANSDGWAHWPAPCRACRQLIELIDSHYLLRLPNDATEAQLRKAAAPIKAFYSRTCAKVPTYPEYPGAV